MIKKYSDEAAYQAAGFPTDESRIALIESTNDIRVDGVNVQVDVPETGDAVYHDGSKVIFFKGGDQFNAANLPESIKNNTIGVVLDIIGDYALITNKDQPSYKYADVLQYVLDAPTLDGEEHTQSIGLRLSGGTSAGYGSYTTISFTYTATTLEEVVIALNTAIEVRQEELGFTNPVWAYLADDDYNMVTENATKILIQIDTWTNSMQINVQGGTFVTWRDMPVASTNGWRVNGENRGETILSVSKGVVYYTAHGRTPTKMVQLNENNNVINRAAFNGEFGVLLREAYGTYENYVESEYSIMYPQKLGAFGLPDGKYLTKKYGNMKVPTKNGEEKYIFPALHYPLTIDYDIKSISAGDFFCPGVAEGVIIMDDDRRTIYNKTAAKMNIPQINNSSYRWFSQRSRIDYAWCFNGLYGLLGNGFNVNHSDLVQGVALLKIKH